MSLTVHTVCFYKRFQPNCREVFFWPLCWSNIASSNQKSDNLQYNTIRRWDDGIPPSDGPIIILIEWKYFSETVACWLGLMVYHFVNKDLDFILFPIYQNNIWTIRRWDNHTVIPSSHRMILKIVGFLENLDPRFISVDNKSAERIKKVGGRSSSRLV